MISPVSDAVQPQPQPPTAPRPSAPQAKPQPPAGDTVQLSGAKAIVQEALETSTQTAREASGGDSQAVRLLAREAAARAAAK